MMVHEQPPVSPSPFGAKRPRSARCPILLAGMCLLLAYGQAQTTMPLSSLDSEDLAWEDLPGELTEKVIPLTQPEDLRLKVGTTGEGQEFLRILPPRLGDLSLGIKSSTHESYVATAKRAVYWPGSHLLRLEKEVIVSSTICLLEGKSFDIHLLHDTVRIENPKQVQILDNPLPIRSDAVRISGLGGNGGPILQWDPSPDDPTPTPTPTPTPAPPAKRYTIDLTDKWKIRFEDEELRLKELQDRVIDLASGEPDAQFTIEQEPSVGAALVGTIHRMLEENGFTGAKTVMVSQEMERKELDREIDTTVEDDPEIRLPGRKGGRLLWIQAPGSYLLNGKEYNEATLRQTLRMMGRISPEVPIVLAGPKEMPIKFLKDLVQDLGAYGFQSIQIGVDPGGLDG